MSEASIAIAASGRDWALGLHRFVADHGGARVRVRVLHPEQALEESYDVLVIDDITSFLSAHLVQQVQRHDRKVLGVFEEAAGEQRLAELGVNAAISADAHPESFISAIVTLAAQRTVDEEFAELIADLHEREHAPEREGRGRITAVAATGGGVGATEIAVGIAADLARRRVESCLIDADDLAPTVAQRLDLPLHPNLRTAMDALQHGSGTVEGALHPHPAGFSVLPGLPNVRDWGAIRAGNVIDVISDVATRRDSVLVNISSMVEPGVSGAPGEERFGVARLVLAAADTVVLVTAPSPMGMSRAIEWLADTRNLMTGTPLHVVVNRFEDGSFIRGELEQEVRDVAAPASVTFVPYDSLLARAAWEGTTVPRSAFTRAVVAVTDGLTAVRAPRTRRLRMGL